MSTDYTSDQKERDKKVVQDFLGENFSSINDDQTPFKQALILEYQFKDKREPVKMELILKTPLLTALEESVNDQVPSSRKKYLVTQVIPALIRSGANVNKISDGISPLSLAIILNDASIVELLIKAKVDIKAQIDKEKMDTLTELNVLEVPYLKKWITPAQLVNLIPISDREQHKQILRLLTGKKFVHWAKELSTTHVFNSDEEIAPKAKSEEELKIKSDEGTAKTPQKPNMTK